MTEQAQVAERIPAHQLSEIGLPHGRPTRLLSHPAPATPIGLFFTQRTEPSWI